jgi:hypothetical protein
MLAVMKYETEELAFFLLQLCSKPHLPSSEDGSCIGDLGKQSIQSGKQSELCDCPALT